MATLTVSGTGKSGKSLTATLTYSVASTDTQTTLTISGFTRTHGDLTSYWVDVAVEIDGETVWESSDLAGTQDILPKTITWNKGTSAQQKVLGLHLYESIWKSGDIAAGNDFTRTTNISVPALASYTVSYNANGHGTAPSSQTKYYGRSLTLRAAISATGYTFVRWNTNASNTGTGYAAGASYTGNAALTLYAIWNHTVTYNANGGSGAPSAQTALATSAITLSTTQPTRSGYKFKGWNTKSDGTGTSYSAGGSFAAGAASVTLYAVWGKIVTGVTIGSVKAIRVDSASSTTEADEGEYAYMTIPYAVKGLAAANVSMTMTVTDDGGGTATVTYVSSTATKQVDTDLSGTFSARASGCDIEKRYTVAITVTAVNTSETQANVTATRNIILAAAFFTMDVKAGGKGVHFGGPAAEDGFWSSMDSFFRKAFKIVRDNVTARITIKRSDIDGRMGGETPSSTTAIASIRHEDKNGDVIFYSETFKQTDDMTYTSFIHRRYDQDGTSFVRHGFYLDIFDDGSLRTRFPSTASREAWLTGLGINNTVSVKTVSSVSLATGTWVTFTNSGSLSAGTYVVRGHVSFPANATGVRAVLITTTNDAAIAYNNMANRIVPTSADTAHVDVFGIFTITAATTLYLRAQQTSGSALSCQGRLEVLKIH